MNLNPFRSSFQQTAVSRSTTVSPTLEDLNADFAELIESFGGNTFHHGLYRILRADQIDPARDALEGVFPEFQKRIVPFGYDWLGRHFAIDLARVENGHPQVLMLEVGAGEAMRIPASIEDFHNVELVEYADDALSRPFWNQWREKNPEPVAYDKCVGYKIPLFLGGVDDLTNLEVSDLSVYVEICGQLRNKVRSLPEGQTIGQISIE